MDVFVVSIVGRRSIWIDCAAVELRLERFDIGEEDPGVEAEHEHVGGRGDARRRRPPQTTAVILDAASAAFQFTDTDGSATGNVAAAAPFSGDRGVDLGRPGRSEAVATRPLRLDEDEEDAESDADDESDGDVEQDGGEERHRPDDEVVDVDAPQGRQLTELQEKNRRNLKRRRIRNVK